VPTPDWLSTFSSFLLWLPFPPAFLLTDFVSSPFFAGFSKSINNVDGSNDFYERTFLLRYFSYRMFLPS